MKPLVVAIVVASLVTACDSLPKISITMPQRSEPAAPTEQTAPAAEVEVAQNLSFSDYAPRGYARLLNDTQHGFRYSVPGEPVRRGAVSERYELRSDECAGSDCGKPRYRTEIRAENARSSIKVNKDNWIGWSFYNANINSSDKNDSLKTVFGQWKLDGDIPSAVRIVQLARGEGNWSTCDTNICSRSNDTSKDVVIQLDDMQQAMGWGAEQNNGYICQLFSMQEKKGKWVDIVLNSNFANDESGYLRVWIDGELACAYYGRVAATSERKLRRQPNHRRGIFVSYTSRWDQTHDGAPKPTLVAYYDEFRTGNKREDVDTLLLERKAKRPVD